MALHLLTLVQVSGFFVTNYLCMENTIIDNQSKCLRLIEQEKSLFFFNGIDYENPSIEELKKINDK